MEKTVAVLVYDHDFWAYWRRAKAIQKYVPPGCEAVPMTVAKLLSHGVPDDATIAILLDYASLPTVKPKLRGLLLVTSFSADCRRRDELFHATCRDSDWVVCLSRERYEARGPSVNCSYIPAGVDLNDFGCDTPLDARRERVLWIGKPTENKGWSILAELQRILPAKGFEPDFRPVAEPVMDTAALRAWYNSGAYILCASRSEATANTVTEAVACGCVAVTTKVGNAAEWGIDGENLVFCQPSVEGLLRGLSLVRKPREEIAAAGIKAIHCYDYRLVASHYWDLLGRLQQEGARVNAGSIG